MSRCLTERRVWGLRPSRLTLGVRVESIFTRGILKIGGPLFWESLAEGILGSGSFFLEPPTCQHVVIITYDLSCVTGDASVEFVISGWRGRWHDPLTTCAEIFSRTIVPDSLYNYGLRYLKHTS